MSYVARTDLPALDLWARAKARHAPLQMIWELTARCTNACRHCMINLPAGDHAAREAELTLDAWRDLARQSADLGVVWCLLTGGDPLLREDFPDLYLMLKRMGLLVSVFTNACLLTEEHVALFRRYPPRDLEVTVYGATRETYERVTRAPGSYAAFRRGLDLLRAAGLPVTLKAVALRSNQHEMREIAAFCRAHGASIFRFDPFITLRYDGDAARNAEILAERLSAEEIVALEQGDAERAPAVQRLCAEAIPTDAMPGPRLFRCGAGVSSFAIGPTGTFRLCPSLCAPDCTYDLRTGSLADAWEHFVPTVRTRESHDPAYLETCGSCRLVNLCLWCPAHAHLEVGRLDAHCEAFCRIAHARVGAVEAAGG